jgi:hypothetical protein
MNPTNIFETLTSIQNQFQNPGKKLLQDKLIAIKLEKFKVALGLQRKRPMNSLES